MPIALDNRENDIVAIAPYGLASTALSNLAGQFNGEPVQPIAVTVRPAVGAKPTNIKCPECGVRIRTTVEYQTTAITHFLSLMMCWTVCLCCLPYCTNSCRNADHSCPMCGAYIGTYKS